MQDHILFGFLLTFFALSLFLSMTKKHTTLVNLKPVVMASLYKQAKTGASCWFLLLIICATCVKSTLPLLASATGIL